MKSQIVFVGLIASQIFCLADNKSVEKERKIWGSSHIRELAPDGKERRLALFDVSQGPEHLLGSFVLNRLKEKSPPLTVQGRLNKSGEFTANVRLEVSDQENGDWKTVESSLSEKVDVTLTAALHIDKLFVRVQLDALQPYLGKFKLCRVTLQTGESDVFPLVWLTEKGE